MKEGYMWSLLMMIWDFKEKHFRHFESNHNGGIWTFGHLIILNGWPGVWLGISVLSITMPRMIGILYFSSTLKFFVGIIKGDKFKIIDWRIVNNWIVHRSKHLLEAHHKRCFCTRRCLPVEVLWGFSGNYDILYINIGKTSGKEFNRIVLDFLKGKTDIWSTWNCEHLLNNRQGNLFFQNRVW